MTVKITLCKNNQLSLLRNISIETYRDTFSESNSETLMLQYFDDVLTPQKLLQEFNVVGSHFYFIYLGNEVAGFLKVNEGDAQSDQVAENSLEIERFYIRKQFLRNGLGRKLMQFAYELAEQLKKSALWLGVWEGNLAALAFYETQGFYKIGEHPFDMAGDIQTDLLLKRDV
jgi:ribosomal protein S18 acetylase RimI-like enzyme